MLEVGDVVFEAGHNVQHPAIVSNYNGELSLTELDAEGAFTSTRPVDSGGVAYRCRNKALAMVAADYAVSASFLKVSSASTAPGEMIIGPPDEEGEDEEVNMVAINGAPVTPYSNKSVAGRYYGWQAHRYSGVTAPFEHDALYRAFKWAGRLTSSLSRNKGMTCDVFICACFHAAAINLLYGGNLEKIQANTKILSNGRSAQKAQRAGRNDLNTAPSGTEYENSVLRNWSNVGAMKGQSPEFLCHWMSTLSGATKIPSSLDEAFTTALLVDAKFTDGTQMMTRMENDKAGWKRL